jgi:septal ring factor EnvC (AmiA/AmiB activator)
MQFSISKKIILIVTPFFFCACSEDSELVKKHGEQEVELAKLRGELALIEEQIKNMPQDQSAEVKKFKEKQSKLETELNVLDSEVAKLEAEKKKLERDYEEYRRRYVVR